MGSWLLLLLITRQAFIASIGSIVLLNIMYVSRFRAPDNFLMYFSIIIIIFPKTF
jgi:hypothetical protein